MNWCSLVVTPTNSSVDLLVPAFFSVREGVYFCNTQYMQLQYKYEGHSINKLQNHATPSILKIVKIWNMHFVGNLIQNIRWNFLIMMLLLWCHQLIGHSLLVYSFLCQKSYHNSLMTNSIGARKKRINWTS